MDIKELNKKQLVLLTLLITFVVSIATGIVTVSLMQQMPKSVPQTINNVIQRTIEKVTTIQAPEFVSKNENPATDDNQNSTLLVGDGNVLVSIYSYLDDEAEILDEEIEIPAVDTLSEEGVVTDENVTEDTNENADEKKEVTPKEPKALGQGIIISDVGLILVESKILTGEENYKVILDEIDFNASILKKFSNGFTILKINPIEEKEDSNEEDEIPPTPSEIDVIEVDN